MSMRYNGRYFLLQEASGEIIDVHQNGLQNSGAAEWRYVMFSLVMFGSRDLYSSGVDRSGGHYPTRAFFYFRSASLLRLWWPPIFLIKKHCLRTNYRYQPTGTASCAKIWDDPILVMVVWVIFIGCNNMNAVFKILKRLSVKNSMFESWNTCIS